MESKEEEGAELMDVIHQAARCHAKEAAAVSHQDADFDRVSRRFRYRVFSFSFPFFFWYRIFFFFTEFFFSSVFCCYYCCSKGRFTRSASSPNEFYWTSSSVERNEKKKNEFSVGPWTPSGPPRWTPCQVLFGVAHRSEGNEFWWGREPPVDPHGGPPVDPLPSIVRHRASE